ncbi:MAG: lipopolysaccharide heptosyltransferase II [Simkaniaceae bacterium]|nr:lipopolysaccharide heptosyltransferase II [Simkaniaceae bacterium]
MKKKIVVRMPNPLGDFVMATAALSELIVENPGAHVTVICPGAIKEIAKGLIGVDRVVAHGKEIVAFLKAEQFDFGVLFTNSFSSAWEFFRGGVKERLGYVKDWRRFLLTQRKVFGKEQHLVETYKELISKAPGHAVPRLKFPEGNFDLPESKWMIGVNPGAAYGPAKCWPAERFRAVTEELIKDESVQVVYFGTPDMRELVSGICEGLGPRVIDLCGKTTLTELCQLIDRCDVFLTNDSGPMHIAAALRTPLVAIFGSTCDIRTGPYLFGRVIHKRVDCSPCFKRTCPIDFRCMKQIEVEEVYQEVRKCLI